MVETKFLGMWNLVSWIQKTQDGKTSYPFGVDAIGHIIYTSDGFMSASLMTANRVSIGVSLEKLAIKPRYLMAIFRYLKAAATYVSYAGTYKIVGDTVVHHVQASLYPDWVGTDLVRSYVFSDNRLTLRAEDPPNATQELVWEKARKK
ncbi:MAG: lipocalin-like domain-containing protein [Anaerolineae bacterium]|nr:lipocalin-like domain-containing protein [Anaerolineae bacterium]